MRVELNSKERLLTAINLDEPDHVPLCLKWWERPYLVDVNDRWHSEFERVLRLLKLGIDDTITLKVPISLNPEVKVKVSKIHPAGERYPVIVKEYHTIKGVLRRIVRQTPDWPHGDDIPLFTDFVIPKARSIKFLVERDEDLDALSCLLAEPSDGELKKFFEEADKIKSFADKHGILVESGMAYEEGVEGGVVGADALHWLCGLENTIRAAYTNPEFIQRILDIIFEWDIRYIRLAIESGAVDLIVHRGWYENADFWPPRLYEKFIFPYVKKLADYVHKHGLKFCYIMSMGIMPLLDFFKEARIDVLYGVDPVQGGAKLQQVKEKIGDSICIWGGLNSSVTLKLWSGEEIEKAVKEAIEILAPGGGFILSAIDQVFPDTPWENLKIMLNAWRRLADYPISD